MLVEVGPSCRKHLLASFNSARFEATTTAPERYPQVVGRNGRSTRADRWDNAPRTNSTQAASTTFYMVSHGQGQSCVAGNKTTVIIHEGHQVHATVLLLEHKREQVGLPELVGYGTFKRMHTGGSCVWVGVSCVS